MKLLVGNLKENGYKSLEDWKTRNPLKCASHTIELVLHNESGEIIRFSLESIDNSIRNVKEKKDIDTTDFSL